MNTQKSTLVEIIRNIEDDMIQIVGINGLGGVGKTTLVSEVAVEMKNYFAHIVFILVSKTIDSKMIQEKVEEASRRIINGEKVLIILDDVWEELKLHELGIPCGVDYRNCKILLTSRSRDVCEAMNAKIISVNPLEEKEAWTLFQRVVGKSKWDNTLKKIALKIVRECYGLPLFVQALGKALKNKEVNIWKTALRRLQAPIDGDVTYKREGLLQLKLSYDYLEDEVAKSCFLLCSMFPEDGTISLKRLISYGLGLGIFNSPHSIQDAKDRVRLAVESLKSSFLLLPEERFSFIMLTEKEEYFKMHDLVREMALFITSKDQNKFLVLSGKGLTEWPPIDDLESYKKISFTQNKIRKLPSNELVIPHLDTFLIRNNKLSIVPDEFFQGVRELKVLDMSGNKISSLPQSLKLLTKLRTLDLSGNKSLREISVLGELRCLQILKLTSTGITKIPKEIGQLTKLRLLDVYSCLHLSYVAPCVISKFTWLEELYVRLLKEEEGSCNFIEELSELKWLKILHLKLPNLQSIPKKANFQTLIEFDIGEPVDGNTLYYCKRRLHISESSFPFNMPTMKLIQVSEGLELSYIKDLHNILPDLYQESFDELKYIELRSCGNVTSLVKTGDLDVMQSIVTLDEPGQGKTKGKFFSQLKSIMLTHMCSLELLWDSPHQCISFCNLVKIYVKNCPSLLELFPLSVAQGLVNLRDLYISDCERLVAAISARDEQTGGSNTELVKHDPYIMFPVADIHLDNLPKLESFYSGYSMIKYPSLRSMKVKDCCSMKRWSYGENRMPMLSLRYSINDYMAVQRQMTGTFEYSIQYRDEAIFSAP